MIEKYMQMLKDGYELVSIHEVINDLKNCSSRFTPKYNAKPSKSRKR